MRNHRLLGTIISAMLIIVLGVFLGTPPAHAYTTPTLSVTNSGSNIQLTVHGDSYSNIQLGYYAPGASTPTAVGIIGTTDGSGNFSSTLTYGAYSIPTYSTVYVTVNGINSTGATWPGSGTGSGTLALSQTNATLNIGQNITITSSNGTNLTATVNNSIVTANSNSNQITITGVSYGNATVTICSSNVGCASVYVTVNSSGTGSLNLSQTNVTLTAGQSTVISSYNGVNLSASSNSSVVNAVPNASNQVTVSGVNPGTATVTICSTNAGCATVYVTVQNISGSLNLSQTSLTLNAAQSTIITSSNGVNLSASSNNPAVATVSANYNQLTVTGVSYGTAVVTVCSSNVGCGSINVTVQNSSGTTLALSQTNVTLIAGQSTTITSSNGTNLTVSSNNVAVASTWASSGNQISIYGASSGTAVITVCSSNVGCANVNVTVQNTSNTLALSQTNLTLNVGQSSVINSSNGTNLTASVSNSTVTASSNSNQITITGISNGTSVVTVCSSNVGCANVYVTVNNTGTGSLNLSQTNVTLTTGQSTSITSSNGTGLTVSSNNSAVASAWISSNNQISIYGASSGTAVITVCSSNAGCANVTVTVNSTTNNTLNLNQPSVTLEVGGNTLITSSNGYNLTAWSNNSSIVTALNSGNGIALTGMSVGTATVTICSTNVGCANVNVTVNPSNPGPFGLNQTYVTLSVGGSVTLYTSKEDPRLTASVNNSNATAISNSDYQVTITGVSAGTSVVTVCSSNRGRCVNVYVTVTTSGTTLALSQTNLILNTGQNATITSSNGTGLTVSSNNSSVASAWVSSGNQISVYGSSYGTATLNICSTNVGCANVYVTVQNSSSTSTLDLSESNLNLAIGQGMIITSRNGMNLTASTNPAIVRAVQVYSNQITVYGVAYGTATVTICSNNAGCGNVYVNVGNSSVTTLLPSGNNDLFLRSNSVMVKIGQTSTISPERKYSYTTGYTLISNSNQNIASATTQGNSISIQGINAGSTTLNICSTSNPTICGTITVTVDGSVSLSQRSLTLNNTSPSQTVTVYGTGPFLLTGNTNPKVVAATLNSNNTLTLAATGYGTATITVCQANSTPCASISVNTRGVSSKHWFKKQTFKPARR
jgi:hypothetical protein